MCECVQLNAATNVYWQQQQSRNSAQGLPGARMNDMRTKKIPKADPHTHTHTETCTYTEAMQGKAKQSHNQRPDSNSPGGKATNRREPHIDRERPMQQQHTRRRRRNLTRRALECGPTTSQIQNKPTGVELELLVFWLEPSWVGFRLEFQCCKWR